MARLAFIYSILRNSHKKQLKQRRDERRMMRYTDKTFSINEDESKANYRQERVAVITLRPTRPETRKKVVWTEDTVDNEHMNKKKSKCCCIYEKPKKFDESDSEDSDDECEHCFGHVEKKRGKHHHHQHQHQQDCPQHVQDAGAATVTVTEPQPAAEATATLTLQPSAPAPPPAPAPPDKTDE